MTEGDDELKGIWSGRLLPIMIATQLVMAIVAFDGLAIVAALPSITGDLGRVALAPWVISAFLATSAVAGIVAGPVIDAVGVRRTFRVTGVWFLLTSAGAVVAPSMEALIAIRVAQGMGGGLLVSVVMASVGLSFPHRLRPRAFAATSLVWGLMGFGGPAVVGLLLTFGGWRFIFGLQVPLTVLALLVGWSALPSTRDRPERVHTDLRGIFLIAGFTVAMLIGASQLGVRWGVAIVGVIVAVITGWLYWRYADRVDEPVLRRTHLMRFPLNRIHLTVGLILVAGLSDAYLPLYVQTTRGQSASVAAFSVLFVTVGWTSSAFIVSRLLDRWREVDAILLGAILIVPSVAAAGVTVAWDLPLATVFASFFVMGMAIGFVSTAGLTLLQSSSSDTEMGRVNSAHQFIRTLGITFSVTVGGAILLTVVDFQVGDVEAVRQVLSGDEVDAGSETLAAIGDGLTAVMGFAWLMSVGCLWSAWTLRRRMSSLSSDSGLGDG